MRKQYIHLGTAFISIICILSLSACSAFNSKTDYTQFEENSVYLDPSAPVIEFAAETETEDGIPEYYLFDDNPEHLNSKYLADGEIPSSIAHFENLKPGIYTVFSYHHRGYSVDLSADLYFDAAFSSDNGAVVKILNLGLDHDWNWNQVWADYTNQPVLMPEYVRTINCDCSKSCGCKLGNGECTNSACPAVIRNERRDPKTSEFDNLNSPAAVRKNKPLLLSELVNYIDEAELNNFRYGSYNEPMWLMLRFEVVSGAISFDTLAYQDKAAMLKNFPSLKKGAFDNEAQYKGIANNAPYVTARFSYTIDDDTRLGAIPVTVKNMRVPEGCTLKDGTFATNVNTWKEKYPIAAESDIMLLRYIDDTKLDLYGTDVESKNNVWFFDPFHTKLYDNDYNETEKAALRDYGISTDSRFEPNIQMIRINCPSGNEASDDEFYSYTACNLGNFGVIYRYMIHIENNSGQNRKFEFEMKSIAGQVYRFKQTDERGNVVDSDGGNWYMKKFDDDPAEDPESKSEPKERLKPAELGSVISFELRSRAKYDIEIETATLTGCTAPMHNTFYLMPSDER